MNNDLIKEFARQAGFKVNWQHEDMQAIKMAQYNEFAELIVKECAQFIFVLDAEPVSHKSAARMLQDHFGINT